MIVTVCPAAAGPFEGVRLPIVGGEVDDHGAWGSWPRRSAMQQIPRLTRRITTTGERMPFPPDRPKRAGRTAPPSGALHSRAPEPDKGFHAQWRSRRPITDKLGEIARFDAPSTG
jgi:hypothetical protein